MDKTLLDQLFSIPAAPNAWFDFKEGISFKLNFVPKAKFREISDESLEWAYDERTKTRQQKLNSKLFQDKFLKVAVSGWRNLTYVSLSKIAEINLDTVVASGADINEEIPYSHSMMIRIEQLAYDLDQFISQQVCDIRAFRPNLDNELKNSKSTPSTTSTG